MTTEAERPRIIVSATVKTKAEAADGWTFDLEIPSFKSSYPTKATRVPDTVATLFKPGDTYTVELEQEKLKQGKTGEKPYDYYYGLVGLAKDGATPTPSPTLAGNGGPDLTRLSIERQKALGEATNLAVASIAQGKDFGSVEVLKVADTFFEWLRRGHA